MTEIIRGLSNDKYHHGEKWAEYVSSSQLKHYLKSPKAFRHSLLHPEEEKKDCLEFGSLFHSCVESWVRGTCDEWLDKVAVFEPPVNEKTGQPYGSATKAYSEAYVKFLEENRGKTIANREDLERACGMAVSLFERCGETSKLVKKIAKNCQGTEISFFYETEEGVKLKIRPDLLTNNKLIDWKTCICDLDEDSIVRQIARYRYDVSLAMYQWVLHEISGRWYAPYLVFVSKEEPYDAVIADMRHWCYNYERELDFVAQGIGAMEFKRLLDLHAECMKRNEWPGAEALIKGADGDKVMRPAVPGWLGKRLTED